LIVTVFSWAANINWEDDQKKSEPLQDRVAALEQQQRRMQQTLAHLSEAMQKMEEKVMMEEMWQQRIHELSANYFWSSPFLTDEAIAQISSLEERNKADVGCFKNKRFFSQLRKRWKEVRRMVSNATVEALRQHYSYLAPKNNPPPFKFPNEACKTAFRDFWTQIERVWAPSAVDSDSVLENYLEASRICASLTTSKKLALWGRPGLTKTECRLERKNAFIWIHHVVRIVPITLQGNNAVFAKGYEREWKQMSDALNRPLQLAIQHLLTTQEKVTKIKAEEE